MAVTTTLRENNRTTVLSVGKATIARVEETYLPTYKARELMQSGIPLVLDAGSGLIDDSSRSAAGRS